MKITNINSKLGVTLIELIIVVVIIGVLSTLAITKFTQGNYSEKSRIARAHDTAVKISAAARHAKNSEGVSAIDLTRDPDNGRWNGTTDSANGIIAMQDLMASIPEELDIYIGYLTGSSDLYDGDFNNDGTVSTGDADNIWEIDSDEVIFMQDPEINDFNPTNPNLDTWLITDMFGEVSYHQTSWVNSKFSKTGPITEESTD